MQVVLYLEGGPSSIDAGFAVASLSTLSRPCLFVLDRHLDLDDRTSTFVLRDMVGCSTSRRDSIRRIYSLCSPLLSPLLR